MTTPDEKDRRPTRETATQQTGESLTATITDLRRPCRYCDRARPVVPVGVCRWWDTCSRCARGLSTVERRYGLFPPPEPLPPVDPWAERVAELLADAEARCSA